MEINYDKYPLPKRMRHHTASNLYFPLNELKTKPDYYPDLIHEINWKEHFINGKAPDILDIGCGKGALLFDYALLNPVQNILGIEVRSNAVRWIQEILSAYNINNASALWYSVVNGLSFIEDSSIEKIFYLFPDPWPKKKHLKRRAFNADTLEEYSRILKTGAELYLATDLEEVHDYHLETVKANGTFQINYKIDDSNWLLPVTNKEKFCRKEGIAFFRLICKKINKE